MATQLLGGTLGVSIGGAIALNKLQTGVKEYAPGLSDDLVKQVSRSVSAIHNIPPGYLTGVIHAYSDAIGMCYILFGARDSGLTIWAGYIFVICIPAGVVGALGALSVQHYVELYEY